MRLSEGNIVNWMHATAAAAQLYGCGRLDEARRQLESALRLAPSEPGIHHLLGLVMLGQGESTSAIARLQRALELAPRSAEILTNLGRAHSGNGEAHAAVDCYRRALSFKPYCVEALFNLGNVLYTIGQPAEAIACYRQLLLVRPDLAMAHYNLGNVLYSQADLVGAQHAYQRAIQLDPTHFKAHENLGMVLSQLGDIDAAILSFNRASGLNPSDPDTHYNAANALAAANRLQEAADACSKGLSLRATCPRLLGLYMHTTRRMCKWNGVSDAEKRLIDACERGYFDGSPFTLLSLTDSTSLQLRAARRYAAARFPHQRGVLGVTDPRNRKVRVAYCSADFGNHVMSTLFAGLFELHDRAKFEIHGVCFGKDDGSAKRKRVLRSFDRVHHIREMSDDAAVDLLRSFEFDIAIDMKGYTRDHRAGLFSRGIAPIQVNYVGYPGTMGAEFMDYILVDSFVAPSGSQSDYSERLFHLPDCYWINDRHIDVSDGVPERADHGLPKDAIVYCSFSNTYKITPDVFDVWMRVMSTVPNSVLWLLEDNAWVAMNLRAEANRRGVAPERLVFAKRVAGPEHLARHRLADVCLDTFPYNGHTTVSDALWMDLPVVTMTGQSFASRVAGSMLSGLGLSALISDNLSDYASVAVRLGTDIDARSQVRSDIEKSKYTATIFNAERMTRHLEAAYLAMLESARDSSLQRMRPNESIASTTSI